MKCPSQTLKDVGNSHEGKEWTAGEPLDFLKEEEEEEEVILERQVDEVESEDEDKWGLVLDGWVLIPRLILRKVLEITWNLLTWQ